MLSRRLVIILLSAVVCLQSLHASGKTETDMLLAQLDSVIANRDTYIRQKEAYLAGLHQSLDTLTADMDRFLRYGELFDAYHSYNTDSAYVMSTRRLDLAQKMGDPQWIIAATLNKANILAAVGMYTESLNLLNTINVDDVPDFLRPYYFHTSRTVYGYMAEYAAFKPYKERYIRLTDSFRDSLLTYNDSSSIFHVLIKADQLNVHNQPREALNLLENFMLNNDLTEHDHAICAWTLSESYGLLGDTPNQKKHMLIAAISDMKSAVLEYVALRQLALLLYQEGDLDHAYKFLTIAVEDAAKCNARQRIVELNDSYPMVNGIYVETVRHQKKNLERTIIIIAVVLLIVAALLVYTRKQRHRLAESRRKLEEANNRLNEVNGQLTESNDRLNEVNDRLTDTNARLNDLNTELRQSNIKLQEAYGAIAEISELKEVYIGRYMDQSLAYIEMLDGYRKQIAKMVNSGKNDELKKFVKSSDLVDDELKHFYEEFDRTFLSLFPTFVEDFNNLLLPEEAIMPKKEGTLTTELRIFALIRLGITDSDKIAKFLRYSLTTIYNYRTKVRNKARGDRNMLENEIAKIGRQTN